MLLTCSPNCFLQCHLGKHAVGHGPLHPTLLVLVIVTLACAARRGLGREAAAAKQQASRSSIPTAETEREIFSNPRYANANYANYDTWFLP